MPKVFHVITLDDTTTLLSLEDREAFVKQVLPEMDEADVVLAESEVSDDDYRKLTQWATER